MTFSTRWLASTLEISSRVHCSHISRSVISSFRNTAALVRVLPMSMTKLLKIYERLFYETQAEQTVT